MEKSSGGKKARAAIAAVLLSAALAGAASGQYPARPVRFIVPSAAGAAPNHRAGDLAQLSRVSERSSSSRTGPERAR